MVLSPRQMHPPDPKDMRIYNLQRRLRKVSGGRGGARLLAACGAVFVLTVSCGLAWPHLQPSLDRAQPIQHKIRVARVIDGDTLVTADGTTIRILNIDTAEMPPRAQCDEEARLARAAKARLEVLVADGNVITLTRQGRDLDRFGRSLRRVGADGRDVGDVLVGEGLAQRWQGYKAQWC